MKRKTSPGRVLAHVVLGIVLVFVALGLRDCECQAQRERRLYEQLGRMADVGPREQRLQLAAEYEPQVGETPEALRVLARAYLGAGAYQEQLRVLSKLVQRGQSHWKDHLEIVRSRLLLNLPADDATYREGVAWIEDALRSQPDCFAFDLLVKWTKDRPEHVDALTRAATGCRLESLQREWFDDLARLGGPRSGEHACDAVIRGSDTFLDRCIECGTTPWKIGVAKAMVQQDVVTNLRRAANAPDTTVWVMRMFATTLGVPAAERCAAAHGGEQLELQRFVANPPPVLTLQERIALPDDDAIRYRVFENPGNAHAQWQAIRHVYCHD